MVRQCLAHRATRGGWAVADSHCADERRPPPRSVRAPRARRRRHFRSTSTMSTSMSWSPTSVATSSASSPRPSSRCSKTESLSRSIPFRSSISPSNNGARRTSEAAPFGRTFTAIALRWRAASTSSCSTTSARARCARNTSSGRRGSSWTQHVAPNDTAAVVYTSARRDRAQEFTSDRSLLLASIAKFAGTKLRSSTLDKLDGYYQEKAIAEGLAASNGGACRSEQRRRPCVAIHSAGARDTPTEATTSTTSSAASARWVSSGS